MQVEMQCKDGSKIAVSFWLTKAENTDDCDLFIAVIEPVQRVVSRLVLDEAGDVLEADEMALALFYCSRENLVGSNLNKWIPNVNWPVNVADLNQVRCCDYKRRSIYFI